MKEINKIYRVFFYSQGPESAEGIHEFCHLCEIKLEYLKFHFFSNFTCVLHLAVCSVLCLPLGSTRSATFPPHAVLYLKFLEITFLMVWKHALNILRI